MRFSRQARRRKHPRRIILYRPEAYPTLARHGHTAGKKKWKTTTRSLVFARWAALEGGVLRVSLIQPKSFFMTVRLAVGLSNANMGMRIWECEHGVVKL
jgi:hypothetical protein